MLTRVFRQSEDDIGSIKITTSLSENSAVSYDLHIPGRLQSGFHGLDGRPSFNLVLYHFSAFGQAIKIGLGLLSKAGIFELLSTESIEPL